MRVRLDLDDRTYNALMQSAVRDMRPVTLHAEYLLRTVLGVWPVRSNDQNNRHTGGDAESSPSQIDDARLFTPRPLDSQEVEPLSAA